MKATVKGTLMGMALLMSSAALAGASANGSAGVSAKTRVVYEHLYGADTAKVVDVISEDGQRKLLLQPDKSGYSSFTVSASDVSREVSSKKGVHRGQQALCAHLNGNFSGRVESVFENGLVEITTIPGTTTFNDRVVILNQNFDSQPTIVWSQVPHNAQHANMGYDCTFR